MSDIVTSFALFVALAMAVRQDLLLHRIPNWVTLGTLAAGLATRGAYDGVDGLLQALAGAAVGVVCFLPLYIGKGTGAGDVKLMGAVGAFLGPGGALLAVALTLVCGAVLALALVLWRLAGSRAESQGQNSGREAMAGASSVTIAGVRKERFPYAIAIGLGTAASLWKRGTLDAALSAAGLT